MGQLPWESAPEEPDESAVVPEPVGPFNRVEPSGRSLTERARERAGELAAVKRLADEINKSLAEYARHLKYERMRDR